MPRRRGPPRGRERVIRRKVRSLGEEVARKEEDGEPFWVNVAGWLTSSSAFFASVFVVWTLMVRRRLYRAVEATMLRGGTKLDG